ncbi:hypothetical protein, partial [Klebsiella pneumoniae]|uniref:hypothetical protein n=1 Tax=Klebsiella pneumoniae TaxID=573 RepID=UPI001D0D90A4
FVGKEALRFRNFLSFSWKLKYPLNACHCCMDSRTNSNKLFFFGDFTPPDFRRMPTLCRCRFL